MATFYSMKLAEYVQQEKLTAAEFGRRIDLSRSAVLRLMKGERRPSWAVLDRISRETGGAVQPADFLENGCPSGNDSQAAQAPEPEAA